MTCPVHPECTSTTCSTHPACLKCNSTSTVVPATHATPPEIKPKEIPIIPDAIYSCPGVGAALRIGTGNAGHSGLLKALAEAFITYEIRAAGAISFQIEWYSSDTSLSIDYLRRGIVDVAITYHAIAEYSALQHGIADRVEYAWRDHWMLVGPKANPAKLRTAGKEGVYGLFMMLYAAMLDSQSTTAPIKFLSRYDKSACNIAESNIWTTIGQVPWVDPAASWYHKAKEPAFPALRKAAQLSEYTLTDRGTWYSVEQSVRDAMIVFAEGKDDELDPLLNPAHLLVGKTVRHRAMAIKFADWMLKADGGQAIVKNFTRHEIIIYGPAPVGTDPLGKVKQFLPDPNAKSGPTTVTTTTGSSTTTATTSTTTETGSTVTAPAVTNGSWPTHGPVITNGSNTTIGSDTILTPAQVKRVAANVPGSTEDLYWFQNDRYARIVVLKDQLKFASPKTYEHEWKSLWKAGFKHVDAILPVPYIENRFWVFSGSEFVCIDVWADKISQALEMALPIQNHWPGLAASGFSAVDAVLSWPLPGHVHNAWFFRGDKCVLTRVEPEGDYVQLPVADTKTRFPGLAEYDFVPFDTAVWKPGREAASAYFFKADQYLVFDPVKEKVVHGPVPFSKSWKSLVAAGFF